MAPDEPIGRLGGTGRRAQEYRDQALGVVNAGRARSTDDHVVVPVSVHVARRGHRLAERIEGLVTFDHPIGRGGRAGGRAEEEEGRSFLMWPPPRGSDDDVVVHVAGRGDGLAEVGTGLDTRRGPVRKGARQACGSSREADEAGGYGHPKPTSPNGPEHRCPPPEKRHLPCRRLSTGPRRDVKERKRGPNGRFRSPTSRSRRRSGPAPRGAGRPWT